MHSQAVRVKELIRQGNRRLQIQNMQKQSICGWDFRFHAAADFQDRQPPTPSAAQVFLATTGVSALFLALLLLAAKFAA